MSNTQSITIGYGTVIEPEEVISVKTETRYHNRTGKPYTEESEHTDYIYPEWATKLMEDEEENDNDFANNIPSLDEENYIGCVNVSFNMGLFVGATLLSIDEYEFGGDTQRLPIPTPDQMEAIKDYLKGFGVSEEDIGIVIFTTSEW